MTHRFHTTLPREGANADLEKLRRRQAELRAARRNVAAVARRHVLAQCHRLRREVRSGGSS